MFTLPIVCVCPSLFINDKEFYLDKFDIKRYFSENKMTFKSLTSLIDFYFFLIRRFPANWLKAATHVV